MERDVIAPKINFGTYRYYVIVTVVDGELEDLVTSEYSGRDEPDLTQLPLLIFKNNYVIDRKTGDKLPISKQVIVNVSQGFAENYGFACVGCSNFESLPATKY
jgi:hypothetical protein